VSVEEHPRDIPHRLDHVDRTGEISNHHLGPEFAKPIRAAIVAAHQHPDRLPLPRSTSTTESLTLPEAQAAPVIRYMAVNVAADG
jgi:hypothetical protein